MLTSNLVVNLVDPATLTGGRVNSLWRPGLLDVRIDRNAIEPIAAPAIAEMGAGVLRELAMLERHSRIIVRYYLERDIPGSRLIAYEVSPWQVDVYVRRELMTRDISQELAGHGTYILRRYL